MTLHFSWTSSYPICFLWLVSDHFDKQPQWATFLGDGSRILEQLRSGLKKLAASTWVPWICPLLEPQRITTTVSACGKMLDKALSHTLSRTFESSVSGVYCLTVSDCKWTQKTETTDSRTRDNGEFLFAWQILSGPVYSSVSSTCFCKPFLLVLSLYSPHQSSCSCVPARTIYLRAYSIKYLTSAEDADEMYVPTPAVGNNIYVGQTVFLVILKEKHLSQNRK